MYLRLLRLGASICVIGTVLAAILIPAYATGGNRGNGTLQFNRLTLARVEPGEQWRLWVTAGAWCVFVAGVLHLFWQEWALFYKNRQNFLAFGDEDMIPDYRYTVRVEQIKKNSNSVLRDYFERLFPGKVVDVSSCLQTKDLESLVASRHKIILSLEAIDASIHANPSKPAPTVMVCLRKVDAQQHYQSKLAALNEQIDARRKEILEMSDQNDTIFQQEGSAPSGATRNQSIETTTAFVTFATLGTKEAAVQCELNGDPDSLTVFPASDPKNTIWSNCAIPVRMQKMLELVASLFWSVGVLFWSVPVAFVAAISNLNSILKTFNVKSVDETSALYGLVSGLLPVIALAILMALLFMAIQFAGTSFIRYKSRSEVEKYTLFWHMMYQFANLWLILIGGSLFNQVNTIFDGSEDSSWTDILDIIANAMPGASSFFVNLMLVSSFGAFGLELSMVPVFFTTMVMGMMSPEANRTQRQLDDAKNPPSIVWGKQIPPIVFIFLVVFLYMPIVPLMVVFGLMYFSGMYVVWKHQCLHVYAQEFEGGGDATWQQVFGFLMACLYIAEGVFIVYIGIKQAPTVASVGFVPLVATVLIHRLLFRKLIAPTRKLSLNSAATYDLAHGEFTCDQRRPYQQPVLASDQEEREPFPYRRALDGAEHNASSDPDTGGDLVTKGTDEENDA